MKSLKLGAGQVLDGIDVTNQESINAVKNAIGDRHVDILINNAGILTVDNGKDVLSKVEDIRNQFEVNTLGPLLLTLSLRSNLANGSKVAIITSRMGSIDDNTSGGCYGYRISKAAVNMAGMNLHRDLSPSGISVGLFHPGFVATDMTAGFQSSDKISPEKSANGLLKLITALTPATSGRFVSYTGDVIAW